MKLEYVLLLIAIIISVFAFFKAGNRIKYEIEKQVCAVNLQKLNSAVKMYNIVNAPDNYFEKYNSVNQKALIIDGFLDKPLDCPGGGVYLIKNNKIICSEHSHE